MIKEKTIESIKLFTIYIFSILYVIIGIKHFQDPEPFLSIMPKIIPEYFHKFFVYLSGFFEIYFGLLILFKEERKFGSWGLIALLICVFPANLYLLLSEQARESFSIAVGNNEPIRMVDALIRIPFQIPLILCAYWYTLDKPKRWFSYLCIILFIPTIYYFVNL